MPRAADRTLFLLDNSTTQGGFLCGLQVFGSVCTCLRARDREKNAGHTRRARFSVRATASQTRKLPSARETLSDAPNTNTAGWPNHY